MENNILNLIAGIFGISVGLFIHDPINLCLGILNITIYIYTMDQKYKK